MVICRNLVLDRHRKPGIWVIDRSQQPRFSSRIRRALVGEVGRPECGELVRKERGNFQVFSGEGVKNIGC